MQTSGIRCTDLNPSQNIPGQILDHHRWFFSGRDSTCGEGDALFKLQGVRQNTGDQIGVGFRGVLCHPQ
jgi:hypothetical protein